MQLDADVDTNIQSVSSQVRLATERINVIQHGLSALQTDREQLMSRTQNEYQAISFVTYVRWIWLGRRGTHC